MSDHEIHNFAPQRVIMHTSEPSGLGHYVSKMVLALASAGVPVVLFCPANSSDEAEVRAAGVEVVHAASRETTDGALIQRLWRNIIFLAKSVRTQFRLVHRGDIVHFQGLLHLPLGFAFLLMAKCCGGSIVLTAHDPLPHRWRLPRSLRWLERGMLHLSYLLCDRIIVHNQIGKDVLLREFHLQQDVISVIPHGWYPDAAKDKSSYPDFDSLSLLAFGSIRENKGLHLAIQAVQAVASESRLPIRLTIAGRCDPAEERYWKMCKELIAVKPGVIDVIERSIEDAEVAPLLERHHALVLPYTDFFSESGVATLALSHQRPILGTTQGGLQELVAQGKYGILIHSPTVASVAQAILSAVEAGPERLRQMGVDGNNFIRQTRSWDFVSHQTAGLYTQLLPGRTVVKAASPAPTHKPGQHSAAHSMAVWPQGNSLDNLEANQSNRILILITALAVGGGAESQVVSLATELKARNWEVCVVCMVKAKGHYVSVLEQQHIEVHSLNMKAGVPDPRAIFRLRSIIQSFHPDVVHSHMFHSNILARITRLFCPMPWLICTAHNLRETSQRDGPTWHKEMIYRATDALADQTTIICKAGFDRYIRVGAVPRNRLRVVPNGIDMDLFTRSELRRESARRALGIGSEFVWLAVGRLVKQKDYPTLLRALATMERNNFIVLIAGSGPLEQELREDCAKYGLNGCVRFCGTREAIVDLYNAADAFVMSSKFEGLSMALLEAASMGLPAVVTDVGGNSEIVIDNVTGYLIPQGKPAQLAAALQRLMDAPPEARKTMGLFAQRHCRDYYHIGPVMDQWLELYARGMPTGRLDKVLAA